MSNTLTKIEITRLPKLVPSLLQIKLEIDHWQKLHAEAGSQKEIAWRDYNDAVDKELPRHVILDMYATAMLFEAICVDTWEEHEKAKKNLLAIYN